MFYISLFFIFHDSLLTLLKIKISLILSFLIILVFCLSILLSSLQLSSVLRGHQTNSTILEKQMISFVDNVYSQWISRVNIRYAVEF